MCLSHENHKSVAASQSHDFLSLHSHGRPSAKTGELRSGATRSYHDLAAQEPLECHGTSVAQAEIVPNCLRHSYPAISVNGRGHSQNAPISAAMLDPRVGGHGLGTEITGLRVCGMLPTALHTRKSSREPRRSAPRRLRLRWETDPARS